MPFMQLSQSHPSWVRGLKSHVGCGAVGERGVGEA